MSNLLIRNARLVNEGRVFLGWMRVKDALIDAIGQGEAPQCVGCQVIDAEGAYLLPGAIDEHVHFREPGLTQKADIASESRAAVSGGVTSFIDMPNTRPLTTTIEAFDQKCDIAAATSMANYGFFLGATNDNIDELLRADYSRVAGVKLFLGSSTGNMLVDRETLIKRLLTEVNAVIAVHAESERHIAESKRRCLEQHGNPADLPLELHSAIRSREACFEATKLITDMARQTSARVHVLHISTADELSLFDAGPVENKRVTAETCPQYLLFNRDMYAEKGARIKCNPAIKDAADSQALLEALREGRIDCIGSDHAPHLLSDKEGGALKAASGMPLLQFSLRAMLSLLPVETVVEKMCHNPARIFRISRRGFLREGYFADFVLVKETAPYVVTDDMVLSRCGWTPLRGTELRHRVVATWVNGLQAWNGREFAATSAAQPLRFG